MEPQPRVGVAALTQVAFDGGDLNLLRDKLMEQCRVNPVSAGALMDLSVIEQLEGKSAQGLALQSMALETCQSFLTYKTPPGPITLLVYAAPIHMGGNTPVEFLLPQGEINIVTYFVTDQPTSDLPPHDVAFCAAPADAHDADVFFDKVRKISAASAAPVLNLPDVLVKPERDILPGLFERTKGLRIPKTLRIGAADLEKALNDQTEKTVFGDVGIYPYVVRPVGSHAGFGLAKIENRAEFLKYLSQRTEEQYFVGEFIHYASRSDRQFRKYRIVLIDGQAYPCHMAISEQWNVWYMNADMQRTKAKRREEAAFMTQFGDAFGAKHATALGALCDGMGLDYFGLDCAEDENGDLVVFEVDNALIVHDMDCRATYPYKACHMQRIFDGFQEMVLSRHDARAAKDAATAAHAAA